MVSFPSLPVPDKLPPLTLLDVKNHLYTRFLLYTTFNLKADIGEVTMGVAYDDPKGIMAAYKEPLLRTALEDMVKSGHLMVLDQVNGVYMLTQPLGTFNQTVVISPYTANLIADAFNFFARSTNPTPYIASKLAITDAEINAVAQICFAQRDELDEMYEDMMGDDEDGDDDDMPPGGKMTFPGGTPGVN